MYSEAVAGIEHSVTKRRRSEHPNMVKKWKRRKGLDVISENE